MKEGGESRGSLGLVARLNVRASEMQSKTQRCLPLFLASTSSLNGGLDGGCWIEGAEPSRAG
jgi:hypothetical protein